MDLNREEIINRYRKRNVFRYRWLIIITSLALLISSGLFFIFWTHNYSLWVVASFFIAFHLLILVFLLTRSQRILSIVKATNDDVPGEWSAWLENDKQKWNLTTEVRVFGGFVLLVAWLIINWRMPGSAWGILLPMTMLGIILISMTRNVVQFFDELLLQDFIHDWEGR